MKTEIVKIKKIEKVSNKSKRYDITTKNNHNFFANNILVHNSLALIYFYNGEWRVATRGSFNSEQAIWAKKYLDENVDVYQFDPSWTILAEIVYKENRIVVNYDFEGLVLHGGYYANGLEFPSWQREMIRKNSCENGKQGFRLVKSYLYKSVEDIFKVAEMLDGNEEGFVVRFEGGYRLKIKGQEYCRIHRLISKVTPNRIWECMVNGDDMIAIRKQLPEELYIDFDSIVGILSKQFSDLIVEIKAEYERTKNMSDKECGLYLKDNFSQDSVARSFVFPCRKKNFLKEVFVGGSGMRKMAFNAFRPKGNKLNGYRASTAMNRFSENEG